MARRRFGTQDVVRLPQRWSDRFIDLEVEGFAGFERFDVPVELKGFKQRDWKPVGHLREFAMGQRAPRRCAAMKAQNLTNTTPNRYPDVFRTLRARVEQVRGADLGQASCASSRSAARSASR